jgi:hypothetical protein
MEAHEGGTQAVGPRSWQNSGTKESQAGQPGGHEMRNISRPARDKTKLASPVSP